MQKKQTNRGSTQKTPEISKKLPPTASDTVKSPCDHNVVYFWDRGSMVNFPFRKHVLENVGSAAPTRKHALDRKRGQESIRSEMTTS